MVFEWTPEYTGIVKSMYPTSSYEEMRALIPHLTRDRLNRKAKKLGLTKNPDYIAALRKRSLATASQCLAGSVPWNKSKWAEKVCEICGTTFEVKPSRSHARYCSCICSSKARQGVSNTKHPLYNQIDCKCQWCDKGFKVKPHRIRVGSGRYCSKQCAGSAMAKMFSNGYRSSIEIAVEEILIELNEPFESQKPIGPWLVDFYLPNRNLVIECDGTYWHSLPNSKRRDTQKNNWMRINDYMLARISEESIRTDAAKAVKDALDQHNTSFM